MVVALKQVHSCFRSACLLELAFFHHSCKSALKSHLEGDNTSIHADPDPSLLDESFEMVYDSEEKAFTEKKHLQRMLLERVFSLAMKDPLGRISLLICGLKLLRIFFLGIETAPITSIRHFSRSLFAELHGLSRTDDAANASVRFQ